jgi:hypothetical protein
LKWEFIEDLIMPKCPQCGIEQKTLASPCTICGHAGAAFPAAPSRRVCTSCGTGVTENAVQCPLCLKHIDSSERKKTDGLSAEAVKKASGRTTFWLILYASLILVYFILDSVAFCTAGAGLHIGRDHGNIDYTIPDIPWDAGWSKVALEAEPYAVKNDGSAEYKRVVALYELLVTQWPGVGTSTRWPGVGTSTKEGAATKNVEFLKQKIANAGLDLDAIRKGAEAILALDKGRGYHTDYGINLYIAASFEAEDAMKIRLPALARKQRAINSDRDRKVVFDFSMWGYSFLSRCIYALALILLAYGIRKYPYQAAKLLGFTFWLLILRAFVILPLNRDILGHKLFVDSLLNSNIEASGAAGLGPLFLITANVWRSWRKTKLIQTNAGAQGPQEEPNHSKSLSLQTALTAVTGKPHNCRQTQPKGKEKMMNSTCRKILLVYIATLAIMLLFPPTEWRGSDYVSPQKFQFIGSIGNRNCIQMNFKQLTLQVVIVTLMAAAGCLVAKDKKD